MMMMNHITGNESAISGAHAPVVAALPVDPFGGHSEPVVWPPLDKTAPRACTGDCSVALGQREAHLIV